jgi:hypothetical protein
MMLALQTTETMKRNSRKFPPSQRALRALPRFRAPEFRRAVLRGGEQYIVSGAVKHSISKAEHSARCFTGYHAGSAFTQSSRASPSQLRACRELLSPPFSFLTGYHAGSAFTQSSRASPSQLRACRALLSPPLSFITGYHAGGAFTQSSRASPSQLRAC